jgi:16S rRNA A1518/A1519 N6-dimethyltransferase RsmA/KsgA/DIM1 with predicted DNA glycosylase/AP lyase activity
MEHALLKLLHESERSWWYQGRASIVDAMLPKSDAADAKHALDIGAGYGGMFSLLSQHADDVYAYEPDAWLLRR